MRSRRLVAGLVVASLLAAGGGVGGRVLLEQAEERRALADRRNAADVAVRWLAAWQDGRYADVDPLTAGSDAPSGALRRTDQRLQVASKKITPGALSANGLEVPYVATATLTGLGEFAWDSRVLVTKTGRGWRVSFDARTVHTGLGNGHRLDRRSSTLGKARRGEIVDRKGRPIRAASQDLADNVLGHRGVDSATGLERVLDDRLAGRPPTAVVVADALSGQVVSELQTYPAIPPAPVPTTLDLDIQRAAEAAIAGHPSGAALVALDAATGQVRAVASQPTVGVTTAFQSYAPGSVFKIVTAAALLQSGLRPSSPVECPPTYRGIGNARSVRPGPTTLLGAFAQSCNTTFLSLAERLPDEALQRTAASLGFGTDPILPIAAESGSVPTGGGPADAAAPIGQGRVEASPLLVASIAAAVSSGAWRQPSFIAEPQPPVVRPLDPGVAAALRTLMRAVVAHGTGTPADLPGTPVFGKTGTAETGAGKPAHAWFAGYRGGLAFCVFVRSGTSGGGTAAPVAARFLRAIG